MLRPGRRAAVCVIAAGDVGVLAEILSRYLPGQREVLHLSFALSLLIGQDAGLIRDIPGAGELGERIVGEAEALLKDRLPKLVWAS